MWLRLMTVALFACIAFSVATTQVCSDEEEDSIDYGDLTKPGTGRVIKIKNGHSFEVFGERVFLSGASIPGLHRGKDFGNDRYNQSRAVNECYLRKIHQAGGNAIKVLIHDGNFQTPHIDKTGLINGLDRSGTFISDIKMLLRAAGHYDIIVFLQLWDSSEDFMKLHTVINDEIVLQSYVDKALTPLITAIKDEPGFGGIEILNKMEKGMIKLEQNHEPCFDTRKLTGHNNNGYSLQNVLRFVSIQADAIRKIDFDILVSAGSMDGDLLPDHKYDFNYLTDDCLKKAGGRNLGYLSYYMIRTFHGNGGFNSLNFTAVFNLDKPVVLQLGVHKDRQPPTEMFKWAYATGYSGVLSHIRQDVSETSFTLSEQLDAMKALQHENNPGKGGLVSFAVSKYQLCLKNAAHCLLGK